MSGGFWSGGWLAQEDQPPWVHGFPTVESWLDYTPPPASLALRALSADVDEHTPTEPRPRSLLDRIKQLWRG